jgi:hypothetical protein
MPEIKLMNSLLAKNAMKINGFFTQKTARNTSGVSLLTAVFLTVFSSSAFANRPAMDEPVEMTAETQAQTEAQTEQANVANRPEAEEGPSAVEVMMQQEAQPQQTGDVLQLPAKEIQAGETLRIKLLDNPRRGMSMDRVQQEFGQPVATSESVGKPPITHWTYSDRVVYFEYSTVLHVVAR